MVARVSLMLLPLLLVAAACRSESVPTGAWGGDHVALTVEDTGARVELDCAHGTVDHALQADSDGRFDAAGTYVREHGGPIRQGEPEDSSPARFTGHVDGRTLKLTIAVEGGDTLGPFTLVLGKAPRLMKCR